MWSQIVLPSFQRMEDDFETISLVAKVECGRQGLGFAILKGRKGYSLTSPVGLESRFGFGPLVAN